MATVFISHSNIDDEFVTRLANDLTAADVDNWVDHVRLDPGEHWPREIGRALRRCDVMIVVLSDAAVESEEVEAEWIHFLREKKRVLPVKIDNCELPYRLGVLQYVDFTGPYDAALNALLRSLNARPGQAPDLPQISTPDEPHPDEEHHEAVQYTEDQTLETYRQVMQDFAQSMDLSSESDQPSEDESAQADTPPPSHVLDSEENRDVLRDFAQTLGLFSEDGQPAAQADSDTNVVDDSDIYAALVSALQTGNLDHADRISIALLRDASGLQIFDSDEAIAEIPAELMRALAETWIENGHNLRDRDWVSMAGEVTTYVALLSFKTYLKRRLEQVGY